MYRGGPLLAGASTDNLALPLAELWRYTAPYSDGASHNPASPAVADGVVYMSTGNTIAALDAATGALKWRYPEGDTLPTPVRTSPAVADGIVVFGSADGKMFGVDTASHHLVWTFDSQNGISASPIIADGIVYFGTSDGRLWALNVATGTQIGAWKGGVRAPEELAGPMAFSDGIVYALTIDQTLYGVMASTGKLRTMVRLSGPVQHQCPIVSGGYVYVADGPAIECVRATNVAARRWARQVNSDIAAPPAVSPDGVFFISTDGRVFALDPLSGRPIWKRFPTIDQDVNAAPVVAGHTLIVGTARGSLYGFDTLTGAEKWTYTIDATSADTQSVLRYTNVSAAPVVSDGDLYVFTDDGSVSCFSPGAVDTVPPIVSDMEPEPGIVVNGAPPIHYQAKLYDYGSGVDVGSIRLYVDDEPVLKQGPEDAQGNTKPGFTFDRITSLLKYDSPKSATAATVQMLADGRHVVRLVASDWKGNTIEKTWSFTVDNTLRRLASGRQVIPGQGGTGQTGTGARGYGGGGGNRRGGQGRNTQE